MFRTSLALALLAPAAAAQVQVVVPNDRASLPGDTQNRLPFGPFTGDLAGRYQQVYGAQDLTPLAGQPITSVAFRLEDFASDFPSGFSYPNLRVGLSTSTNPVNGLSTVFQANVGLDAVTVFDGPFDIPPLTGQANVNPFDLEIVLDTAFTYSGGDLLLDIEIQYGGAQPVFYLDAHFTTPDAISRALDYQGAPVVDTLGLVTRFGSETPVGSSYCFPAIPNSTGQAGRIQGGGTDIVSVDSFFLNATQLPPGEPGYFLASRTQGFVPNPGGSQGNLCLGLPLARFASQITFANASGAMGIQVDLNAIPLTPPVAVQAGETWNFQCWYRDQNPGPTSNFTDAVSVQFQ